ncbi:M20/M25/M40 family metallo-hydrolase [Sphingomonas daechungensis]|uniref:M20/M25/M40 family metallo-hydrolase n=1 Tax=Sphingomonas daechungensis TaxID=1176646 RepID=UPI0037835061
MKSRAAWVAAFAALLVGAAPAKPADRDLAADRVRAHVEFLASDLLKGRDTGSEGHRIAAAYVASEFRELGLKPGGLNGSYFIDVPFRKATLDAPASITLTVNGKKMPLVTGKNAAIRPSVTSRDVSLSAPLVFVGRGIRDKQLGVDDYAGLDVRGKIVVALPDRLPGVPIDVAAHLASIQAQTAGEQGALGIIVLDDSSTIAGDIQRFSKRPVIDWVDSQGRSSRASSAQSIAVSSEVTERIFERAPRQLRAIRADVATGKKVRGFPLPASLSITAKSNWEDFTSPEVVAVLPGSDRKLAAEHVVLMGHLDHLGVRADAKAGEDAIYNGALDNAAGVATMLEAAHEFVDSGKPPRRSVMFIANTGEEYGLLGASYFASHPTVPADKIVGLVDLDMPLLLYDFTDVVAFGAEHSTTARAVAAAGAGMNVAVSPDPMPQESLFVRSDHYPFVKQGVPAVFLMTGYANGGRPLWQKFLGETYHSVKDDLGQAIRWDAGAKFAELNYRIARAMADGERRPMWYAGDYFGETYAPGQPKARR